MNDAKQIRIDSVIHMRDVLHLKFKDIANRLGVSNCRVAQIYAQGKWVERRKSDTDNYPFESVSVRCRNVLNSVDCKTIDDVRRLVCEWKMHNFNSRKIPRNCGKRTINEILCLVGSPPIENKKEINFQI